MGGAFPVTNDDFMARLARRGGNAGDTARVMMLADLEVRGCLADGFVPPGGIC